MFVRHTLDVALRMGAPFLVERGIDPVLLDAERARIHPGLRPSANADHA